MKVAPEIEEPTAARVVENDVGVVVDACRCDHAFEKVEKLLVATRFLALATAGQFVANDDGVGGPRRAVRHQDRVEDDLVAPKVEVLRAEYGGDCGHDSSVQQASAQDVALGVEVVRRGER